METQEIATRFDRAVELGAKDDLVDVARDGDEIVISTGEGFTRRTRRSIRAACMLAAAGGLGLLAVSMWGLALAVLAIVAMYVAPRLIRGSQLLRVNPANHTALTLQAGATLKSIDLAGVAYIAGMYETQGWDPRIVIYFVRREGGRDEGIIFAGANETAARCCCGVLAQLLGLPATYTNQYDATVSC